MVFIHTLFCLQFEAYSHTALEKLIAYMDAKIKFAYFIFRKLFYDRTFIYNQRHCLHTRNAFSSRYYINTCLNSFWAQLA